MLVLFPMTVFAADAQTPPDMPQAPGTNAPDTPNPPDIKLPDAPQMPEVPKGMEATTPPDMNAATTTPSPAPSPASGMGSSSKSMVSTPDGGIIVMSGNKISKFDKDLNVTKTVELSE